MTFGRIDGLALGETTPGPLIMVVAFVGFIGGWTKQALGPEALFLSGALAASTVVRMARTMPGGLGWAVLAFQPHEGTLVNQQAADDTAATAAAGVPILTLELQEVASQIGTAADAADSAEAVMALIDWAPPYRRYQQAATAASEAFDAAQDDVAAALVIDVRRAGVLEKAATMIPGAHWRDPAAVARWAAELPTDREVIVYCVDGHEVGRTTALRLRAAGIPARYLRGGIDGWQSAGRRLAVKVVELPID